MNFSASPNPTFRRYIVRNDVGILVLYEDKAGLRKSFEANSDSYGIHSTWTVIEAETVADAIKIFHKSYEGARIGGKLLSQKALRIDTGRKIVQLPLCALMKREADGRFVCRLDEHNSFGDCVVGGLADFPDGKCPMKSFCNIRSFDFSRRLPKNYCLLEITVDYIVYKFAEPENYRAMVSNMSPSDQPPPQATKTH